MIKIKIPNLDDLLLGAELLALLLFGLYREGYLLFIIAAILLNLVRRIERKS